MTLSRRAARPLLIGAGLLVTVLPAACSGGAAGGGTTPGTGAVLGTTAPTDAGTTPSATVPPRADPTAAASTLPPVDAAALLQAALAELAPGYHFASVVTVNGTVALTAEGDRVGDGSRFTLAGAGGTVNYVVLPAGTWVQGGDGEWSQLDDEPANVDPLLALGEPLEVTVAGRVGDEVTLYVTVVPARLGLPGADPVVVTAVVASGSLRTVRYEAALDGGPAVVEAVIGPVADPSPVVAPA